MERIMGRPQLAKRVRLCATWPLTWQRGRIALLAMLGGAVIIVGALLPWISLFAGLQAYAGISGVYGRLLCGGGALSIIGGIWFLLRGGLTVRWGLGFLGFVLLT